ncbi:MAG: hypothetical protein QM804_12910 [Propionicimonas sp.]
MALSSSVASAHFWVKKASEARPSNCPEASQASITLTWLGGSGSAASSASSANWAAIPSRKAER